MTSVAKITGDNVLPQVAEINNRKEIAIMAIGLTLLAGAVTLWILIAQNQMAIETTQKNIYNIEKEIFECEDFERFIQLINDWRNQSTALYVLRQFPMSILLPTATVGTALGVGFTAYGCAAYKRKPVSNCIEQQTVKDIPAPSAPPSDHARVAASPQKGDRSIFKGEPPYS